MAQDCVAENQQLIIKDIPPSKPGALSRIFGIFSKSQGCILAHISYYSSSRKYVLKTEPGVVWDTECLDFLSEFIKKLTPERKA